MGLSSAPEVAVAEVGLFHLSRGEAGGEARGEADGDESLKSAIWKRGSGGV